jgi:hypothetical protein
MAPIDRWVFLVILFALSTLVSGCTSTITYTPYIAYEGPPQPNEEIAILYCERSCGIIVDQNGTKHDLRDTSAVTFDPIYLEPGEYKVWIMYWFSLSILQRHQYTYVYVTFEAGHTYRILEERRCKTWGDRNADVWIKDETTDTIVAERKHNCN